VLALPIGAGPLYLLIMIVGDKDLMVTNGFYRDFGDQDFINYQKELHNMASPAAERKQS
jgi:hypothetical protein